LEILACPNSSQHLPGHNGLYPFLCSSCFCLCYLGQFWGRTEFCACLLNLSMKCWNSALPVLPFDGMVSSLVGWDTILST
jgi:hypothetical protein